jgi:hypothetical protein
MKKVLASVVLVAVHLLFLLYGLGAALALMNTASTVTFVLGGLGAFLVLYVTIGGAAWTLWKVWR